MKKLTISIRRSAYFILITTAAFSIFSISALWVYTEFKKSTKTLNKYKETYEEEQKIALKEEVRNVINLIDFTRKYNPTLDYEKQKNDVLDYVSKIRLKFGGYIFINTYSGDALIFDGVKIIGKKNITTMTDPDGLRIFDMEIAACKNPDGDFFTYKFKRLDSFSPVPKISYVYGYEDWNWIIGAGIYLDDVSAFMQNRRNQYQAILFKKVLYIVLLFGILLLVLFVIATFISRYLKKEFEVFTTFFNKRTPEGSLIDQNKLHFQEFIGLAKSANAMVKKRRFIESQLKNERDKAHNYLNIAGVIIIALDNVGTINLINKKGCETLGYEENEIIGKNWFSNFLPISVKQELKNFFLSIMKGEKEVDLEYWENKIIVRSGQERTISWHNKWLYNDKNQIIGSLSSGLDISERKKVEASFLESEIKYKLLFEKSSDPVLIISEENTFIDCNTAAIKILGFNNKESIIGTKPWSISPEFQDDNLPSTIKAENYIQIARKDGFTRFEWKHINQKNIPFYVDVSLTVIPIASVEYLYVVWRNISEKKKQEEELISAKEKAEQSDDIKTSFLHNMQHEIRTPLNAIMGFTQLLQQQNFDISVRNTFYDDILSSGHHLMKIIDKIIDFARLQAGFILITNNVIELKKLISDIFMEYHHMINNNDIKLKIITTNINKAPIVKIDISKVRQVLSHLLDNAFKFTEKGDIEISFDVTEKSIVFNISDTGVGIDKRYHDSIFEGFNRLTQTNRSKLYGGNGLGLSISKAVLEFLGGDIWIKSEIGEGSTFSFTVPYQQIKPEVILQKHSYNNKNISIVTSNKPTFDRISNIVRETGVKTKKIKFGMDAIKFLQSNLKSDIMIIDNNIGDMTSLTVIKAIRAFNKEIPIVALLDDYDMTKENALLAGFTNYITNSESDDCILSTLLLLLTDDIKHLVD